MIVSSTSRGSDLCWSRKWMTKLQSFLNISPQNWQPNLVLKANFPNSLRAGFSFFSSFSFFKMFEAFIKSDSYCCFGISDLQADETEINMNLVFRKYLIFCQEIFYLRWAPTDARSECVYQSGSSSCKSSGREDSSNILPWGWSYCRQS